MSYHSELDTAEQDYFNAIQFEHDWQRSVSMPRRRLITREALTAADANVRKDHPRVRRISEMTYGVTCSGKCSHGAEHRVTFEWDWDQLYVRCAGCSIDTFDATGDVICRHAAAAYVLFEFYRNN